MQMIDYHRRTEEKIVNPSDNCVYFQISINPCEFFCHFPDVETVQDSKDRAYAKRRAVKTIYTSRPFQSNDALCMPTGDLATLNMPFFYASEV